MISIKKKLHGEFRIFNVFVNFFQMLIKYFRCLSNLFDAYAHCEAILV